MRMKACSTMQRTNPPFSRSDSTPFTLHTTSRLHSHIRPSPMSHYLAGHWPEPETGRSRTVVPEAGALPI